MLVVLAAAEEIVKATDWTVLFENGEHIKLSLDWAYSLFRRMGYVKRKSTTKARTAPTQEEFAAVKKWYLWQIKKAVKDGKIPQELVINLDQTGVNAVASSQWTQAEKGATRVEIVGAGDKQQITVTVAGTLSGKQLPFQILYEGKNERCHPLTQFLEGFDIWHAPNHWANGETSICFMKNTIFPYISATWKYLGLGEEHMAIWWYLTPSRGGHTASGMESLLLENNVISVTIPNTKSDYREAL